MLVFAEAHEHHGVERFGLRFGTASDNWPGKHIGTARPPFASVVNWPPGLEVLEHFANHGPVSGELGLGLPLVAANEEVIPVLWARFRVKDLEVLLFADDEIPMNVGISPATSALGENARVKL
ncbi:MAG: hypothetical protein EPO25_13525 [Gammaproteobacteria bacterium]|nr:MAG: hypothetical protein EPO25_13525 [Gammaproteobacteria bacterium]